MKSYKYNFKNEYVTEENASSVLAVLEEYRAESNSELIITPNLEKKYILIEDP